MQAPIRTRIRQWAHQHHRRLTGEAAAGLLATAAVSLGVAVDRSTGFAGAQPSAPARQLVEWVQRERDHGGLPCAVVDKREARIFVFDAQGRWRGESAVLLGSASGDDSAPGIGNKPLAQIEAQERTTPAGRFVAEPGKNLEGEDIFWIDHAAAVSMHRVRTHRPHERRLERLASPTASDNRISYGCINLPRRFYEEVVQVVFLGPKAVVYVLPEHRPLKEVFHAAEW